MTSLRGTLLGLSILPAAAGCGNPAKEHFNQVATSTIAATDAKPNSQQDGLDLHEGNFGDIDLNTLAAFDPKTRSQLASRADRAYLAVKSSAKCKAQIAARMKCVDQYREGEGRANTTWVEIYPPGVYNMHHESLRIDSDNKLYSMLVIRGAGKNETTLDYPEKLAFETSAISAAGSIERPTFLDIRDRD